MTDEQIKQNAEKYALKQSANGNNSADYNLAKQDYIAGAHSRDEEIEKLRNPWISVEERLPPIKIRVLFLDKNGKVWLGRNTIAMQAELETDENNNLLPPPTVPPAKPVITHWMPIPELKKGE